MWLDLSIKYQERVTRRTGSLAVPKWPDAVDCSAGKIKEEIVASQSQQEQRWGAHVIRWLDTLHCTNALRLISMRTKKSLIMR